MGQSLSLCQSCDLDVNTTIAAIEREQDRVNRELERLRSRLHDISNVVNKNLLSVSVQMSEINVQLATLCSDIKHIKDEVDNLKK